MSDRKFDNCVDARAYVYNVLAIIVDHELTDEDGWMFGGIDNDFDRRRLVKELARFRAFAVKRRAKLSNGGRVMVDDSEMCGTCGERIAAGLCGVNRCEDIRAAKIATAADLAAARQAGFDEAREMAAKIVDGWRQYRESANMADDIRQMQPAKKEG